MASAGIRHFFFLSPRLRWLRRLLRVSDMSIALAYCEKHPEARASIIAAGERIAVRESLRGWDGAQWVATDRPHRFSSAAPYGKCIRCGVTREADASIVCEKWQSPADIAAVIRKEEELFRKVIGRAEKIAPTLNLETITGDELAALHHTHGIDPTLLEMALGRALPERIHQSYMEAYERHKETGARGQKKVVLVAKTA